MKRRLLLSLLVLLLCWVGLEQIAKFSLDQNESTESVVMPYDAHLLWRLSHGRHQFGRLKVDINNDGFRDMGIEDPARDHVLFLGDSSTFGFEVPVEEIFAHKVAQCLNMNPVNAAVPGYTSTQSMLQWEKVSLRFQPKVLIVASLWSDLVQTKFPDSVLFSEQLQISRWQTWLYHYSYVYRWLYLEFQDDINAGRKNIFWQRLLRGEDQSSFSPRVPIEDYEKNLIQILSLNPDIVRVVLLLPTNMSKGQPKQAKEYRARAKRLAHQNGALVVDMDEMPSEFTPQERFLDVVHPSALGHTEIANKICETLRSQL